MADQTIELQPSDDHSKALVELNVIAGSHTGMHWAFDREATLTIGRDKPANLILRDEPALSRVHLQLEITPPNLRIIDLDSTNGTLVNGVRMAKASLHAGDEVGIGQTVIRVSIESSHRDQAVSPNPNSPTKRPARESGRTLNRRGAEAVHDDSDPENAVEATRVQMASKPVIAGNSYSSGKEKPGKSKRRLEETALQTGGDREDDGAISGLDPGETIDTSGSRIGTEIASYTIDELLGRGGMAEVYLASHRRTGEKVAVKIIRADQNDSEKQLQLFVREAATLTQLDHPRIVKAIEFGVEGTMPIQVMEHIPAIDLLSLLDGQRGEERTRTSAWVVSRVLQAVHYLHQQGIVHRDIKPSNILAFRQKHRLHIKLADFGLAKVFADAGFSGLTSEGSVRGTIAYMSPEQFRDSRGSAPEDDLFSCGACLYRLALGCLPNMISKATETIRVLDESALPEELRRIIAKSMSRNPQERYQSASVFATDLGRFLKSHPA